MYRKYFEPEYGEVAPWVRKGNKIEHTSTEIKSWRTKWNFLILSDLTNQFKDTYCYDDLMNVETEDVGLDRGDGVITLRIYHPAGQGPHPVMVFCHGGSWSLNNLDIYDYMLRYLAGEGGIAVVSVDYRLAPEFHFPVGIEDCYAALEWAAENADSFGGDKDRITVCGDSSGGNFAAVVALMARDRKEPGIRKQILIYPVTSFNFERAPDSAVRYGGGFYGLNTSREKPARGENYLSKPEDRFSPYASPMEETDFGGVAPACFISAECDPLLDQALMYAAKLEDNGIDVEYHLYKGMTHAFINRPYQSTFEALDAIIKAVPRD